jgi:hypothetical protein
MQNAYTKIKNWLLYSSTDPEQIALTIKGMLIASVGSIVTFTGLFGVNLSEDIVLQKIQAAFIVVGSIVAMIGLIRKVLRTIVKK